MYARVAQKCVGAADVAAAAATPVVLVVAAAAAAAPWVKGDWLCMSEDGVEVYTYAHVSGVYT